MLYEYSIEIVRFGLFGKAQTDHHELVRQRAAEGWRLAHVVRVPNEKANSGEAIELYFEREARAPRDVTRADEPTQQVYQAPPSS